MRIVPGPELPTLDGFRPADNKTSVRAFAAVPQFIALGVGLATLLWLFALLTDVMLAAGLWMMISVPLGVVGLAFGIVPNWILARRYGSRHSFMGLNVGIITVIVVIVQCVVVVFWRWKSMC